MKRHPLHKKSEQGAATLIVAIAVAGALSASVYYNFDKLGNMRKEVSAMLERDRSTQANVSSLTQASSLMAYLGTDPQADDTNALPYIYPEPYFGNASVVKIQKKASSASTWSLSKSGDTLTLKTPGSNNLHAQDFAAFADKAERPALESDVIVKFKDKIYDTTYPNWIRALTAEATITGKGNQSTTSEATIAVPRMPAPKCRLVASDGGTVFQPNSQVDLDLYVYGVAEGVHYPVKAEDLTVDINTVNTPRKTFSYVDLKKVANKISNAYDVNHSKVFKFSVTTPRPLYAVDGNGTVDFYAVATINSVDGLQSNCHIALPVAAAASCKLFISKASLVGDGDCTTITTGSIGAANMSTLKLAAYDEGGTAYPSSITDLGNNSYQFCAPKNNIAMTGKASGLSKEEIKAFDAIMGGLKDEQKSAISNSMQAQSDMLAHIFKRDEQKPLLALTIAQVAGLAELPFEKMKDMSYDDFVKTSGKNSGIRGFKSPDADLIPEKTLKTLVQTITTEMTEAEFYDLKIFALDTVKALSGISADTLNTLETYTPSNVTAYAEAMLAESSIPRTFKIQGTVSATSGGQSKCLVHVSAGKTTNACAYLGSSYPAVEARIPFYGNWQGHAWTSEANFKPGPPNWEVDAIPNSPTDVTPCPPGARCYALDYGIARMPFVTLINAEQSSCQPIAATRINLGCFAYDTKIRMADGQDMAIQLIKVGDKVLNPIKNIGVAVKRTTAGPEKHAMFVIKAGDSAVQVTEAHPMITRDGVKMASTIQVGDEIKGVGDTYVKVDSVRKVAPQSIVLNLELDTPSDQPDDHAILADGIVTGDLFLQEKLAKEMPKM